MEGKFISIRSKIFGLQIMVAALVIVVMGVLGLKYYSELVHDKVHGLLEQNNEQAIENVEIILDNAVRLTEYPMLNKTVSEMCIRDRCWRGTDQPLRYQSRCRYGGRPAYQQGGVWPAVCGNT